MIAVAGIFKKHIPIAITGVKASQLVIDILIAIVVDIGKGHTVEQTLDEVGMVVEGIPNCQSIYEVARSTGVRTPLIDSVYSVLYEDKPAAEVLQELLTRAPRPETET